MADEHSGTWNLVGNRYVRSVKLYDLGWSFDLSTCNVSCAPFGGPVALIRDPKKLVAAHGSSKPRMYICTASGIQISDFEWTRPVLYTMGWTAEEDLCVVSEDGTVSLFSMHGQELMPALRVCRDEIALARVFGQGVVIVTSQNDVHVVMFQGHEHRVVSGALSFTPECFDVIPEDIARPDCVEIVFAPIEGRGGIVVATVVEDKLQFTDTRVCPGTIRDVVVSPDGKYVAVYSEDKGLSIYTTDFRTNLSNYDFDGELGDIVPHQILWAGKDVIAMVLLAEQFDEEMYSTILLVDVHSTGSPAHCHIRTDALDDDDESARFIVCVSECDAMRVMTSRVSFLVQPVPRCIQDIYRMTSVEPSALLLGAFASYQAQNPSAVHSIRDLDSRRMDDDEDCSALERAVQDCIEASGQEVEIAFQKKVLQVASYGKCFCRNFEAEVFVEMCRTLRVLNAVRTPEVGIPLTINQFRGIEIQVLIDRLVNRRLHYLAYKICTYLNRKVDKVLVHWACLKVSTSGRMCDDDVRSQIVGKLQQCPGVSFAKVASTAYKVGRTNLAIMLLNEEPKAAEQVPLLLEMNQPTLALSKAVDSGDTDLVFSVLLTMRKMVPDTAKFYRLVSEYPGAFTLLVRLSLLTEPDVLAQYYSDSQQQHQQAMLVLQKILRTYSSTVQEMRNANGEWLEKVGQVQEWYSKAEAMFALRKEYEAQAKYTHMEVDLLGEQRAIARETNVISVIGSTIIDTIRVCYECGKDKKAEALKAKFNVPDKKMWWCRLRALCNIGDWDALEKMGGVGRFASTRVKSPIGFEPFVTELMKRKRNEHARLFVGKIPDVGKRMEYWVALSDMSSAIEDAKKEGDVELLHQLRGRTTNPGMIQQIDACIRQMS
eukprot:PhM_4_TR18771/c0_g1_i1/m.58888/K20180/VPS16; vacuolar protein sorting-associated protein 16